jgi:hypothetical protein
VGTRDGHVALTPVRSDPQVRTLVTTQGLRNQRLELRIHCELYPACESLHFSANDQRERHSLMADELAEIDGFQPARVLVDGEEVEAKSASR